MRHNCLTMNSIRISADEAIIEAAFRVLNVNGAASLNEIATAAGVGRATLHRYFSGRDDLINAMVIRALRELNDVAEASSKGARSYTQALKKMLFAIVPLGHRQWFLSQNAARNSTEINAELDKQRREFRLVLLAAQKEDLFPDTCPVEWAMQTYDVLVYAAWQMVHDGHATPDQAATLAWKTFASGIKKAGL